MARTPRPSTDAVYRFGLSGDNWLRPKPKTFFFAEFILGGGINANANVSDIVGKRMPLMVRTIDRPQFDIETQTYNQYNKPRVVHGKIKYQSVRVIYYDDVDNTALKVFNEYRRFYFGDFQNKDASTSWAYDTVSSTFEASASNWGLSTSNNGDGETSYFFKQLDIYEFYNDRFTVYNLIHPKITSFEMDPRDITEEAISETTVTLEYEGVTHQLPGFEGRDLINEKITPEIAEKVGVRFVSNGNSFVSGTDANPNRGTSLAQDAETIAGLIGQSPAQAIQTIANRVLPPRLRNTRLPNSWQGAVSQASTLTGSRSSSVINTVSRAVRNLFG